MSEPKNTKDEETLQDLVHKIEHLEHLVKNPGDNDKESRTGLGEQMPEEMHIIPIFGRPVMPSQITPVQLSIDWEDVLMKVAETKSKVFAIFSIGEKPGDRDKINQAD